MQKELTNEKTNSSLAQVKSFFYDLIANEISTISRYFDRVIYWQKQKEDTLQLLEKIDCKDKLDISSTKDLPGSKQEEVSPSLFVLNANANYSYDIQELLSELKQYIGRSSRVMLVCYNPYLRFIYSFLNYIGVRDSSIPKTFITVNTLNNLTKISGYEIVRSRYVAFFPFKLFGIGTFINKFLSLIPFLNHLSLTYVCTLRPVFQNVTNSLPSLSILIPARNEEGNIGNALKRMPYFDGAKIEIIFVEGHSEDNTWKEIERVKEAYKDKFQIQTMKQTGKGKADAVRLGFSKATCELLTILDADLTMPPELLERFYFAWVNGKGDFINGSRLVYPMENDAMRFLNKLGNVFFAKALSYVLETQLTDSLCGTKLMSKKDYQRFIEWRSDFGDFDPFGDYEVIFPACILGLGTIDIPIRYRDRTYGSTNISRWKHGMMLLRMTFIGLFKVKIAR